MSFVGERAGWEVVCLMGSLAWMHMNGQDDVLRRHVHMVKHGTCSVLSLHNLSMRALRRRWNG